VKPWKKEKGEHVSFSQPSSGAQHICDIFQVLELAKAGSDFNRDLVTNLANRSEYSTHMLLTSDNGPDESLTSLSVALPLFILFLRLDLDVLEKYQCTPGNSKMNPVEMAQRSVKRPLKGKMISCENGTEEEYNEVFDNVKQMFVNATHAGLPLVVECSYSQEKCLQLLPYTAQLIADFVTARQKNRSKSDWMMYHPDNSILAIWRHEKRWDFLHLELLTRHMQQHIVAKNLYSLVFKKKHECMFCRKYCHCPEGCDHTHPYCMLPTCSIKFCGTFRYSDRSSIMCDGCPGRPCLHKVNEAYQESMKELASAKQVAKCSICKQEGCRKNICPQNTKRVESQRFRKRARLDPKFVSRIPDELEDEFAEDDLQSVESDEEVAEREIEFSDDDEEYDVPVDDDGDLFEDDGSSALADDHEIYDD
jgi:hypothetical protein